MIAPTEAEMAKDRRDVRRQKTRNYYIGLEEKVGYQCVMGAKPSEVIRFKLRRNAKGRWVHLSAGPGCPKDLHLNAESLDELIDKLLGIRQALRFRLDEDIEIKLSAAEFRRAPKELQDAFIKQREPYERDGWLKLQKDLTRRP